MGGLAGDGGAWSGGRTGAGAATGESATKEKGGTRSARTRRARDGFVTSTRALGPAFLIRLDLSRSRGPSPLNRTS